MNGSPRCFGSVRPVRRLRGRRRRVRRVLRVPGARPRAPLSRQCIVSTTTRTFPPPTRTGRRTDRADSAPRPQMWSKTRSPCACVHSLTHTHTRPRGSKHGRRAVKLYRGER